MKSDNMQSILWVKIQLKTKGSPDDNEQLKVFCWTDLGCLGKKGKLDQCSGPEFGV